jgi:alpha-methylacyl-CoA racemase
VLERKGPLSGLKVVEFAGIGAGPFCAMLLADLGADVVRVDRKGDERLAPFPPEFDIVNRGRRSIAIDLKSPSGLAVAARLIDGADALVEGYRPGVMERLGLGPEPCLERNPGLIYGRMTGFGQDGPLASSAGHDINYIALAGALDAIGPAGHRPVPPLNLVGDYGGGGLMLAYGIAAALVERARSGLGQVVDAAMVDGAATLMTAFYGALAAGSWHESRGTNLLDGAAPYYDSYETSDGKYVAVGALEPKFFAKLAATIGVAPGLADRRGDPAAWPALRTEMRRLFLGKTRAEWVGLLEGTDTCATGVYGLAEAVAHPHNRARGTFTQVAGIEQPSPAPRFGRTPGAIAAPPVATPGADAPQILAELGYLPADIAALSDEGVV